ncbi:MAG: DUF3822 family protein [Flavisolibacter sp.]
MKTVFTIGSQDAQKDILLLEVGQDFCCYAYLDSKSEKFAFIRYISFDELEAEGSLDEIILDLKKEKFQKVVVSSAFAQALLVPQQYYKPNDILNVLMYDNVADELLSDSIPEWQLVTSYSIPHSIFDSVSDAFESVQFFHAYTPALRIFNGFVSEDQLQIHFSTRQFRVMVKKNSQAILAQTYSYKTPLDVVYYLLKICYEFKFEQSELLIVISGLIDQQSAIYDELHNYFLNLHFAQAPSYSLPENEHPHYYFTSLYNLAACVS